MSESNNSNSSISFGGLLQVALIVLKLCGVINWSWPWVLFPIITGVTFSVLMLLLALGAFIIARLIERKAKQERRK